MGRGRPRKWKTLLGQYLDRLDSLNYTDQYIYEIRRVCGQAFDLWDLRDPMDVTEDHLLQFLEVLRSRGMLDVSRKGYLTRLRGYLQWCGNPVKVMGYRWREDGGVRVSWLSEAEMDLLLGVDKNPFEDLVVHLSLCLGLRLVGIRNLKIEDLRNRRIRVTGKFGKVRYLPYAMDTARVLDRWMEVREDAVSGRECPDPGYLIVHYWGGEIRRPSIECYFRWIWALGDRIDLHLTYHTMRRTFGRNARLQGVDLSVIQRIYGHTKSETTDRYVRAGEDEVREALDLLDSVRIQKSSLNTKQYGRDKNSQKNE